MMLNTLWFMQLNPARGRKQEYPHYITHRIDGWFMQLNPARGRKPVHHCETTYKVLVTVYAAQPREGTETQLTRNHN